MTQHTQKMDKQNPGTESLTETEYHRLMSVGRRRTTLAALSEMNLPADLDDLAETVGKREMDKTIPDEMAIDQIATVLHHNHLPMMDSLDVIDYDDTNRVVADPRSRLGAISTDGGDTLLDLQNRPEPQSLPKDVVFGLLSAKRRRDVLKYLARNGPETTLSDLAEHIAAAENDTEIQLLSSQQRKRVYVAMYQCHLPRMDEADVIDFESARGTVELRPAAAQLYQYMEVRPVGSDGTETTSNQSISDRVTVARTKITEWLPNAE